MAKFDWLQHVTQAIELEQNSADLHVQACEVAYDTLRRMYEQNGFKLVDHIYGKGMKSKQTGIQCLTSNWKSIGGFQHSAYVYQGVTHDKQIEDSEHHTLRYAVNGLDNLFIALHGNPELFVDCESYPEFDLALLAKNEKIGKGKKSTSGKAKTKAKKDAKKALASAKRNKAQRADIAGSVADILDAYEKAFVPKSTKAEMIEAGQQLINEIRSALDIQREEQKAA